MITVDITRTDGRVSGFRITGHALYDEPGKDIVCAGVSAVSVGSINAIETLCGFEPNCTVKNGFLTCSLPSGIEPTQRERAELILESMIVSLRAIEEGYDDYMVVND
ncbi:MAG: ribosomal-processing cysteine protease Prp [Bacilli bacterium]